MLQFVDFMRMSLRIVPYC